MATSAAAPYRASGLVPWHFSDLRAISDLSPECAAKRTSSLASTFASTIHCIDDEIIGWAEAP
jgi:hypothetical protein